MTRTRLCDFGSNVYSQFGEDGCVEHIFAHIGVRSNVAVEFGAGDGLNCSNTAHLWRDQEWRGLLVESNRDLHRQLERNAHAYRVQCRRATVTPTGPASIANLLAEQSMVDFMSIDVDGDDYAILSRLGVRPRVISVEFNPTVPPHLKLRQAGLGGSFGASLRDFVELAPRIGYQFIGATYCNAFLVDETEAGPFADYETDPTVLFPSHQFTYAVTDYAGHVALCGHYLPWGTKQPYVLPLEGALVIPPTDNPAEFRRGFEAWWGRAVWLTPDDLAAETVDLAHEKLRQLLAHKPPLVCIDLRSYGDIHQGDWMKDTGKAAGYRSLMYGKVLGLVIAPQATQW